MPDFKKYAGLIILITLYLILSLFSIIELAHFSKFMENEMLRNKLLFTFGLTVGLPVYLGFVKSCKNIKTVRGVFEGASIVIIFFFYFIS
ncbi:MAG TPA: hypothetical protein VHC96_21655, partial [Puia sp.]|nr:hypothetical protein [Puia sp.]